MTPKKNRKAALQTGEWLALAAAIVIAHLFYWRIVRYPSAYDAQGYLEIASDIGRNGLFSKFILSDIRTYGYPLLLSVLVSAASALDLPVGWIVFEAQLALYLLAAVFFRRRMAGLWPSFAPWAFASIVLNVSALSYAPESLTESVSLTLILTGAGCWLALVAQRGSAWKPVLMGSLAMGAAVMVRPANLFALCAWSFAVAVVCVTRRPRARVLLSVAVALVVGGALPMVPQYVNNVRNYGRHTPLIVVQLAHYQQLCGLNLKYATALPPVSTPSIWYSNPFVVGTPIDQEHPLSWYVDHPRATALTLALHVFNMLDQDLLFTYSRDLDPWYRVPVGVLNHALIALALIGAGMLAARAPRERKLMLAATALAGYTLGHVALHVTTLVEMRFGLPLLLAAGPAALGAVRELVARGSWRPRALVGAFVVVWVVGSLVLSHWVRQQAPSICEWEANPWPQMQELKLPELAQGSRASTPLLTSSRGLELEVDRRAVLVLPLPGAQELEFEYEATGILLLTFASTEADAPLQWLEPPWRYRQLRAGRGSVQLDLRQTASWSAASYPLLMVEGTGHLTLRRMRARPSPGDAPSAQAAYDRAVFWAPQAIGHATINSLGAPPWSVSSGTFLTHRLGLAFLGIAAILALYSVVLHRRWRPGPALVVAALVTVSVADALFLARTLPALNLSIELDPEARIRHNYAFAPELGALAALARSTLLAGERVGVLARPEDWFGQRMLCFNLAPRRCVVIAPGEQEYVGLSRDDPLRADEIDAVVSFNADMPVPPGFEPVAEVSPRAFIARRR